MTKIIALLGLLFACASHAEITRIDSYPNVAAQANAFAASPSVDPAVANATIASTRVDLAAPTAALLSAKETHQLGVALAVPPELQSLSGLAQSNAWTRLGDKAYARLQVHAAHAVALRAGLQIGRDFPGRVLSLAPSGVIAVELRRRDGLSWSTISEGDTLDLLIEISADYTYRNGDLSLPLVSYIDSDLRSESGNGFANIFPTTASCAIDIACSASSVEKATGAASIRIIFTRYGSTYACSGTLLGDATKSYKPYVYTANHCIDSQDVADTVVTYWNLQYPTCNVSNTGEPAGVVKLKNGAQLLDHDSDNDHAFLLLNDPAPADAMFAGWDAASLSSGQSIFSVSHPHGDVNKIAYGGIASPAAAFISVGGVFGTLHTSAWSVDITRGVLQQGSSGSGLFTCDKQSCVLRGGAMAIASGQECTQRLRSYFSRFDMAYPRIKGWLTVPVPSSLSFEAWPLALAANTTYRYSPLTAAYNNRTSRPVVATLSSSNPSLLDFKNGYIVTGPATMDTLVTVTATLFDPGATVLGTTAIIVRARAIDANSSMWPAAHQRSVAAGYSHTVAVKRDGSLWTWGSGYDGQLGTGRASVGDFPEPTLIGTGYVSVAAAGNFNMAAKADGSLWAWGSAGQLFGDGSTKYSSSLKHVGYGYASVAVGPTHVAAIKADGSLWVWGSNFGGQIGDGTRADALTPKLIGSGYASVAPGGTHTVAIKSDGSLWVWGDVLGWLTGSLKPQLIGTGYVSAATGNSHIVAIKGDGTLWAWGGNDYGQLGDGTTTNATMPKQVGSDYASVAAAGDYTVAIKTDGSLWAWGNNHDGQLGNGTVQNASVPQRIGTDFVSAGLSESHVVAVKVDGSLLAWGKNSDGQLGDSSMKNSSVPKQIIVKGSPFGLAGSVLSPTDCTLDWLEDRYPSLLVPKRAASQSASPYVFRHYTDTDSYLGVSSVDSHLYYQSQPVGFVDMGAVVNWAAQAGCQ